MINIENVDHVGIRVTAPSPHAMAAVREEAQFGRVQRQRSARTPPRTRQVDRTAEWGSFLEADDGPAPAGGRGCGTSTRVLSKQQAPPDHSPLDHLVGSGY